MTETDATKRPLEMPVKFLPYLEKYRIYLLFKDIMEELIIEQPKDHLKHMKTMISRTIHMTKDIDRVMLLVSPELQIDVIKLAKELMKVLGVVVITRRCVMDRLEKHERYVPGCVSTALISEVTRQLTLKSPVKVGGWLMFDHPCTTREARYLQQDGVLPSATLVLAPPPPLVPPTEDSHTPARGFFQQDFEGLKFVYKATIKDVLVLPDEDVTTIATKCYNAVRACAAGAQGSGQGYKVVGCPSTYRIALIGPLGSDRYLHCRLLAQHFRLVFLDTGILWKEATVRNDEIGQSIRKFGLNSKNKAEIIRRRLLLKDCLDQGWVLRGYPCNGEDFEYLDNMPTPPNRVIFLNLNRESCLKRACSKALELCPGRFKTHESKHLIGYDEAELDNELEYYFTEALAELNASAGITAVHIDCNGKTVDEIQTKLQTAVIQAPAFNIEAGSPVRGTHVRVD